MPNKFIEREQLLLELRMQLEPELDIISEQILKENLTAKLSYRSNEIFLIEIPLNRVFLTEIKLDDRIRTSVSFYQIIEDKYGYVSRVQISPNKKYVPQDILNLGRYYNGSYFLDINDSL
ncbi:MAG: hypothetical protein II539_04265, partial [Muribaculaceae bacterium]|nr:hypothetical protein [Muribaculaceae bacterium]